MYQYQYHIDKVDENLQINATFYTTNFISINALRIIDNYVIYYCVAIIPIIL